MQLLYDNFQWIEIGPAHLSLTTFSPFCHFCHFFSPVLLVPYLYKWRFRWQRVHCKSLCINKLPHEAVHLQGIEPACAGGCLTASRKSPLEGGRFLKGATSGSLGKFVGSARRKM